MENGVGLGEETNRKQRGNARPSATGNELETDGENRSAKTARDDFGKSLRVMARN